VSARGAAVPIRGGALSWGQRWSWNEQRADAAERTATLILSRVVDLPAAADVAGIRAAVRLAVSRHEVLRSTFAVDGNGTPRQSVWPAELELYQIEQFDRDADYLAWLRRPMDVGSAWPLRVAVLHLPGGATGLAVSTHHIATDLYGFDALCQELRTSVRTAAGGVVPPLPPVGRQPVELAAFEQSPAGVAVNDRAIRHWLGHDDDLGEVLASLRARSDRPNGVLHAARVVAPRPSRLSDLAALRHSSEGAVAVAAVACVLAGHLGRARVPMAMSVANRHLEGLRQSVCSVTQSGLISVPVADPRELAHTVPAAWAGMLTGMRHAYYDCDDLFDQMKSLDRGGRHVTVAPPSINIVRVAAPLPGLTLVARPDLSDGRFTSWTGQCDRRCLGLHFHVQVSTRQLAVELRTGAHLLSMDDCHRLAAEVLTLILG
jgi:hypothetical protein